MTAIATVPEAALDTTYNAAASEGEGVIVLRDVAWNTYQSLRSEESNNHVRMTYDSGKLELMSPSRKHSKISYLVGWMIAEWSLHRGIKIEVGGDMTISSPELAGGLEADACFWIANEAGVRDKEEIDLSVDPPPDLALEVDVSRSVVSKLPIYQGLRIPEVWRWKRGSFEVLVLSSDGTYTQSAGSLALQDFPLKFVEALLIRRNTGGDSALMEEFRRGISDSSSR